MINVFERLYTDGAIMMHAQGGSMRPFLHPGDRVLITRPKEPPKKYDVIAYTQGMKWVLHRVIRIEGDCYRTRGDSTLHTELVPAANVHGILTEAFRKNRPLKVNGRRFRFWSKIWVNLHPVFIPLLWLYGNGAKLKGKLRAKRRKKQNSDLS